MHETAEWSVIANHVLQTLPPAFDERHKVIRALHHLMPPKHPMAKAVADLRFGLDHHASQLRELNLTAEGGR